jgi:glucose/arabinose dehydrogenase
MRLTALVSFIAIAFSVHAQTVPAGYKVETVVTGLSLPTTMAFVGPGRFLVLEKNTGIVKHFLNGISQGNALDLAVASDSERGLLGICLDPDFSANGFVYLYYSKSNVDGGSWQDNRVEKFFWNGTTLTFVQTLITFPSDGAQNNGPNHDGGIIKIGPDRKLYIITGDLNRNRLEQNQSATLISGVGGIIRLNLDGSIPSDNPFTGYSDNKVWKYYAYGIRNSFGMTFDPFTNKLWYTENGPNSYDEINVAGSGFNSGWNKLMGPDSRNTLNASDLVYLPNAYYQDPIFSWLATIAPTGIAFLNSIEFSAPERNNMMIADNNNGNLYLFEMNAARDGIIYKPGTEDTVADNTTERNLYRWGFSFNSLTDLVIGPDRFLYAVGIAAGKVYRIRPVDYVAWPDTLSIFRGLLLGGNTKSLEDSDEDRLRLQQGAILSGSNDAPIQFEVSATSTVGSTTQLQVIIESGASFNGVQETIELKNQQTSQWEIIAQSNPFTERTLTVFITSNPSRFIEPNSKQMQARVSYRRIGGVTQGKWSASIDQLVFKVHE